MRKAGAFLGIGSRRYTGMVTKRLLERLVPRWWRLVETLVEPAKAADRIRRARPSLEVLEVRVIPATLLWTDGGQSGIWSDRQN